MLDVLMMMENKEKKKKDRKRKKEKAEKMESRKQKRKKRKKKGKKRPDFRRHNACCCLIEIERKKRGYTYSQSNEAHLA